jgi:hypothetical protein
MVQSFDLQTASFRASTASAYKRGRDGRVRYSCRSLQGSNKNLGFSGTTRDFVTVTITTELPIMD